MNKKYKNVCTILNYIEHFLILASTFNGCISISAFATALKVCAITARIKKYMSIIKKKKKKHDNIILLPKSKLDSIEVLISKALIDSVISHDEFVLIDNVQKDIKNLKF